MKNIVTLNDKIHEIKAKNYEFQYLLTYIKWNSSYVLWIIERIFYDFQSLI